MMGEVGKRQSLWRKPLLGLLLSAFLYWSTGLAQCLHEKYEHAHPAVAQTMTLAPVGTHPVADQAPKAPAQPDDHDDCLTCQSLKIMKAAPMAPPVMAPQLTLLEHASPPTLHREPPTLTFVLFLPARAPPALLPQASA
jgi:hypothetical protein